MRYLNIDIHKFEKYLLNNGMEILPITNEYENIRFKGIEVGVLYKSGKTSGYYADLILNSFKKRVPVPVKYGKKPSTGRKPGYKKEKLALLKRDGNNCFYCGKRLMDDITLEHIIPLVAGGKNMLGNMVLAHEQCNQEAGNLPVYKKMELAIKKRNNGKSKNNS